MAQWIQVDIEELQRLYYKEGYSQVRVAEALGVSLDTVKDRMRRSGLKSLPKTRKIGLPKYSLRHNAFRELNPVTAYWIGWMLSDGFVSGNRLGLRVASKDRDIVVKFRDFLQYTGPLYESETLLGGKAYPMTTLLCTSKAAVLGLVKFGVVENKTLTCRVPSSSLHNEDLVRMFIRGFFEGDGSLMNEGKMFQIVGTMEAMSGIQDLLVKYLPLNRTKLTKNKRLTNHYLLRYSGALQVPRIMDWLYSGGGTVLDRKHDLYKRTCT